MTILTVVKEVGRLGGEYHLAVGKTIEVCDETAAELQDAYPGCFEVGVVPASKKLSTKEVHNG